ncbi:hypothetical protein ACI79D_14005 [Geodermatophilus sp. SYSU D00708]
MLRAKRVAAMAGDFPSLVNLALLAGLGLYWGATFIWPHINLARTLDRAAEDDHLLTLHLGTAALAAMIGGFSGVVVIFGLSGEGSRFRRLRQSGGRRLAANWVSVVAVSFVAAFLALGAAATATARGAQPSVWLDLYAVLLCAHSATRLLWLLHALARVVNGEDEDQRRTDKMIDIADISPRARVARR